MIERDAPFENDALEALGVVHELEESAASLGQFERVDGVVFSSSLATRALRRGSQMHAFAALGEAAHEPVGERSFFDDDGSGLFDFLRAASTSGMVVLQR
ncbi:MAG: hypothetical protein IPM64_00905 [Phycisphaerales bacterium]|nr:hypothetical protein [Phycisphaerales bacterium]